MKRHEIVVFAAGLLFALGLGLSGLTTPAKVLAFLDVAGDWDPSLAFVMAGAIAVFLPAYRYGRTRATEPLPPAFAVPTSPVADPRLLGGAALFGIGWGLAGYCPGPAIVAVGAVGASSAPLTVAMFFVAMLVGMGLYQLVVRKPTPAAIASDA